MTSPRLEKIAAKILAFKRCSPKAEIYTGDGWMTDFKWSDIRALANAVAPKRKKAAGWKRRPNKHRRKLPL